MYVLVLGPWWGFAAIFLGGLPLVGNLNEHVSQALLNGTCSALGPVLAVWLFRILKERGLLINRLSDLIEVSLLYALLNAVIHHFSWAVQQPDLLMSAMQLPIMVVGDLLGAILGAILLTLGIRYLGIYGVLERLSKTNPKAPT